MNLLSSKLFDVQFIRKLGFSIVENQELTILSDIRLGAVSLSGVIKENVTLSIGEKYEIFATNETDNLLLIYVIDEIHEQKHHLAIIKREFLTS